MAITYISILWGDLRRRHARFKARRKAKALMG